MARQFHRGIDLTIAKPKGFFDDGTNAIVVKDLAIAFGIEKSIGKDPNTCEVTIRNLSKQTRAEVQELPRQIRLDAGYDGERQRLFIGDLVWSESKLEGVDWITRLQVADGSRAYAHARVNRSFKRGTSLRIAVQEVATQLGLVVTRAALAKAAMGHQFAAGVSLQGLASREMTRLLRPHGLVWSVQDGRLQILEAEEARPDAALVITQAGGMIGAPEFGSPPEKGKSPVLTVRTLLDPGLTPGGLIDVDAAAIRGTFKVQRVSHAGDTHGEDWISTIEATAI